MFVILNIPGTNFQNDVRAQYIYILLTKTVQNMAAIGKRLQGGKHSNNRTPKHKGGKLSPKPAEGRPGGGGGQGQARGGARRPKWP